MRMLSNILTNHLYVLLGLGSDDLGIGKFLPATIDSNLLCSVGSYYYDLLTLLNLSLCESMVCDASIPLGGASLWSLEALMYALNHMMEHKATSLNKCATLFYAFPYLRTNILH
ncbi:hypothetical protein ACJX0J_034127, partial [Zea mays]